MLWMNGPACVALAALLFSVATLLVKLSSDDLSAFTICAGQCAWQAGLPAGQDRAGKGQELPFSPHMQALSPQFQTTAVQTWLLVSHSSSALLTSRNPTPSSNATLLPTCSHSPP